MPMTCSECWIEFASSDTRSCPSCGAIQVTGDGNMELERFPEFDGWRRHANSSKGAEFTTEQQEHYDRLIAMLLVKDPFRAEKDKLKPIAERDPNAIDLWSEAYLKSFMPAAEKHGMTHATGKIAMTDYLTWFFFPQRLASVSFGAKFAPITIHVHEKWPAAGRSTGTLYIGGDGIKLESKRSHTVNLSFAEISSLGFGESQDLDQQGFRSTLYKGMTLTVRAKNGSIFERHMFWGDKESDFNNCRQLIKSYISRIIDAGLPIQLIDDNGYNASGGYSVGFGMWFG